MRSSMLFASAGLLVVSVLGACSSSSGSAGAGGKTSTSSSSSSGMGANRPSDPDVKVDLQGRTYAVKAPMNLDKTKPAPLLVMLHGFTVDQNKTQDPGEEMDLYMKMSAETEKRGMILAIPKGSYDKIVTAWTWNGTNTCCGWDTMANDIGYIQAMVEDLKTKYAIDDKRIFVLGHSNGGFMANRIACDLADKFAGIVSLAGETWLDQSKCNPSAPIPYLQVQGDADTTVPYEGGSPYGITGLDPAPGAKETAKDWSIKNRCAEGEPAMTGTLDLDKGLAGEETTKYAYSGCEAHGETELWVIHGGVHSPNFNANWPAATIDFLMAHPRP